MEFDGFDGIPAHIFKKNLKKNEREYATRISSVMTTYELNSDTFFVKMQHNREKWQLLNRIWDSHLDNHMTKSEVADYPRDLETRVKMMENSIGPKRRKYKTKSKKTTATGTTPTRRKQFLLSWQRVFDDGTPS